MQLFAVCVYDLYNYLIILTFGVVDMKYSDAQREATARYNKKTYERIDVVVKKGQRQILKDFAASQGKSLNRFILDAVEQEIERIRKESK